jgi:hypothetical protein
MTRTCLVFYIQYCIVGVHVFISLDLEKIFISRQKLSADDRIFFLLNFPPKPLGHLGFGSFSTAKLIYPPKQSSVSGVFMEKFPAKNFSAFGGYFCLAFERPNPKKHGVWDAMP